MTTLWEFLRLKVIEVGVLLCKVLRWLVLMSLGTSLMLAGAWVVGYILTGLFCYVSSAPMVFLMRGPQDGSAWPVIVVVPLLVVCGSLIGMLVGFGLWEGVFGANDSLRSFVGHNWEHAQRNIEFRGRQVKVLDGGPWTVIDVPDYDTARVRIEDGDQWHAKHFPKECKRGWRNFYGFRECLVEEVEALVE